MSKQRHGKPDKFQRDGFAIDERPANELDARLAVERFIAMFVNEVKRERARALLSHRDHLRRMEGIQTVYKWIDPRLQSDLEGNTGFPQHLRDRFGDLRGIVIDEKSASHVAVAGAAIRASDNFGAFFIADELPIAVLFPEIGSPTLCQAKPPKRK